MALFNTNSIFVLAGIQSAVNVKATLTGASAISSIAPDYALEIPTEEFRYSGDAESRESVTIETDRFGTASLQFIAQVIGTMPTGGVTLPLASVPNRTIWRMCGASVVIGSGVDNAASVRITNAPKGSELATLDFRAVGTGSSTQKSVVLFNAQGTIDMEASIGTVPRFTVNLSGGIENPVQATAITPVFSDRANLAPPINSDTLISAEIVDWNNGSPVFTGTSNFCFSTMSHPNMFGYTLGRILSSCETGFTNTNVSSDITFTLYEDEAGSSTIFEPFGDAFDYKAIKLVWSNTGSASPGKTIEIFYSKVQVLPPTNTAIGDFRGQTVVMKCGEKTEITFR